MSEKSNSVDQIRDILFGEQTKKIDKKFAQLEKDISSQFSGIKSQLEALNSHLQQNMASAEKNHTNNLNQMIQDQDKQLKSLEKHLADKIIDTEASILSELQTKVEDVNGRLTQKQDLAQLLKQLADQIAE